MITIGSWVFSLTMASAFMISLSDSLDVGFIVFPFVQTATFTYMVIKYAHIRKIIAAHRERMREMISAQDQPARGLAMNIQVQRSKNSTFLMILSLFIAVWFPFTTILIMRTIFNAFGKTPGSWLPYGFVWSGILTFVNGAINPLIYAIRYKEIGTEMKIQARKMLCKVHFSSRVGDSN